MNFFLLLAELVVVEVLGDWGERGMRQLQRESCGLSHKIHWEY